MDLMYDISVEAACALLYVPYKLRQWIFIGPRSGKLRTQKVKSHLVRTQSLNVLPLTPGVGQYIAIHATLAARNFFLNSTLPVHSPAFFPKHLPIFFLCWLWLTQIPV